MPELEMRILLAHPDPGELAELHTATRNALTLARQAVSGSAIAIGCGCETCDPPDNRRVHIQRLPAPVAFALCAVILVILGPFALCAAALSAAARTIRRWRATREVTRV